MLIVDELYIRYWLRWLYYITSFLKHWNLDNSHRRVNSCCYISIVLRSTVVGFNGVNVRQGIIFGESIQNDQAATIKIDQGLDTTQISYLSKLDPDMVETGFIVQIDSRFGSIVDPQGNMLKEDYIDDDGIAYYSVLTADETVAIQDISSKPNQSDSVIQGPRGVRLEFKIKASLDLQTSSFLFERLGGTDSTKFFDKAGVAKDVRYIDSIIRVSGMNSGYSLDLPVRFVKLQ